MHAKIKLRSVTQIDAIGATDWMACATASGRYAIHPFLHYGFFKALEETHCVGDGTGWHPHYLVLDDAHNQIRALLPLYAKTHSQGEYVFDHAWAQAYHHAGINYYPKWQSCIPFSPVTAPKFLCRNVQDKEAVALLLAELQNMTHQKQFSSAHLTFLPETELDHFKSTDFMLRTDQQFHWHNHDYNNFEGFLSDLSSRKRKAIRKERAAIAKMDIDIVWLRGDQINDKDWDTFFVFYMDTGNRKWGTPYLNRAFFEAMTHRLGDQVLLMFAKRDGQPIAATLNLIGHDTLYGRYWGCNQHIPFLHFELCYYQAIEFAIKHKLLRVEAGAQGEHKLARGYLSTPTYSAHYIAQPEFRAAIKRFLIEEKAYIKDVSTMLNTHSPFKKET